MAYRKTAKVHEQMADKRVRILDAARQAVAKGGFAQVSIASVADAAGVASGTVYRYFESKSELLAEVVSRVSEQEVELVAAIARRGGPPETRLIEAVELFAKRALRSGRLAYALIVEPSHPEVEAVRTLYRRRLADAFAAIVSDGVGTGIFPPQESQVAAAAIVGVLMEGLVGPIAAERPDDREGLLQGIVAFCRRGVAGT